MPCLRTSRNFIIHSLPYICHVESDAMNLLRILSVSNSFMNGSLVPEVFQNFNIVVQDTVFLRILFNFSSTIQFTTEMSLRKKLHHEIHPFLEKDKETNLWKVVKTQAMIPFLPAHFLSKLITSTRYFTRQLTSFDFYSINDCYREVFRDCLPHLRALRHLKIKFPVRPHARDLDHPFEYLVHLDYNNDLYPIKIMNRESHHRYDDLQDRTDDYGADAAVADYELQPVIEQTCSSRVRGCVSHGTKYTTLTDDEIVDGFRNLRNLDTLTITCSREIRSETLAKVWDRNPMPHLKKLVLVFFSHSIGDPVKRFEDHDSDEEEAWHEDKGLGYISVYHPRLESLLIQRNSGAFFSPSSLLKPKVRKHQISPNFSKMQSLREIKLCGVLCPDFVKPVERLRKRFCHELVKLSIGGFAVQQHPDPAVPVDLIRFLGAITSSNLREINLLPHTNCWEHEQSALEEIMNDYVVIIITMKFKLLRNLRLFVSEQMTDNAFKAIGENLSLLQTLHIESSDDWQTMQRQATDPDDESVGDESISYLLDPSKCTSGCYATLEELTINSHLFTGKGWFGSSSYYSHRSHFRLRKLVLHGATRVSGGHLLLYVFLALSRCLEELYLDWTCPSTFSEQGLHSLKDNRAMCAPMKRLRVISFPSKRKKKTFAIADRPTVFETAVDTLEMYKETKQEEDFTHRIAMAAARYATEQMARRFP